MPSELNENTRIPLRLVWGMLTFCLAGALMAASIKYDAIMIRSDQQQIRKEMYPRSEMKDFAHDLAIENREIKVPRVKDSAQLGPQEPESDSTAFLPVPPLQANVPNLQIK